MSALLARVGEKRHLISIKLKGFKSSRLDLATDLINAEEVELLYRYVDGDTSLLQKILVDNPARLHGFDKSIH